MGRPFNKILLHNVIALLAVMFFIILNNCYKIIKKLFIFTFMVAVIAVYSLRALIRLYCHEVKHRKK